MSPNKKPTALLRLAALYLFVWAHYRAVRSLVASNDLPDYRLTYDDKKDVLKVRNRDWSKFLKKAP